jgi:hypothetical protein
MAYLPPEVMSMRMTRDAEDELFQEVDVFVLVRLVSETVS